MFCLCVSLALTDARFTLEKQLRNQVIYKIDLEDHFLFARGNACKCLPASTTYERNPNISLATASPTMCGWLRSSWPPSKTASHLSFASEGTNSQARSCQLGFLRHILCGSSECAMHNEGIYINNFRLVTRYSPNGRVTITLPPTTFQSWSQQREKLEGLGRGGLGCPWPRFVRRIPFSAKTL